MYLAAVILTISLTAVAQGVDGISGAGSHQQLQKVFDQAAPAPVVKAVVGDGGKVVGPAQSSSKKAAIPAAPKAAVQEAGVGDKVLFGFGRFLNMPLNVFKTLLFGSLSIISNIIEGIVSGVTAPFRGDVVDALTWPFKLGLNAGWNSLTMAVNAANVALDPLWQFVPLGDPAADVYLVGDGPRLRTWVQGGPLSHAPVRIAPNARAFVFSSAFIQGRDWASIQDSYIKSHEFGHTLQVQQSFLVDLAVRRGVTEPDKVENEATAIGNKLKVWSSDGPLNKNYGSLVLK